MKSLNPPPQLKPPWSVRHWLLVLGLVLVVRIGYCWFTPHELTADPDGYRQLAQNLLVHGVYGEGSEPTAYRPPLYPFMIHLGLWAPISSSLAIGLLHILTGMLTILLVVHLSRQSLGNRASITAGILLVCDPILVYHSTQVMSETLASCCAAVCLCCLFTAHRQPRLMSFTAAGVSLGAASLCRPHFLAWTVLMIIFLASNAVRKRTTWHPCFAMFLGCGLVLTPWVLRNQAHWGRPIITTTHGGYTLLLGNNQSFYDYLRQRDWGETWDSAGTIPPRSSSPDELAYDRMCYQEAWSAIQAAPKMAAWSSLVKMTRLWGLVPQIAGNQENKEPVESATVRVSVGIWYGVLYVLALIGLWSLRKQIFTEPWVWIVLMCFTWTMIHAVYWSNMRMRAPLLPGVVLLAAAGCHELWRRKT